MRPEQEHLGQQLWHDGPFEQGTRDAGKEKADHETFTTEVRLAGDGTCAREIAQRLGVARSTVQDNLKRATAAGLSWSLPGDLTDDALENRLFARAGVKQGLRRLPEPNWADLVLELKKPGVTLMLLWEEHESPEGENPKCNRAAKIIIEAMHGRRKPSEVRNALIDAAKASGILVDAANEPEHPIAAE